MKHKNTRQTVALAAGTIIAVVLGAILVSGCGSGDDDAKPLTKTQFIKEADKICERSEKVKTRRAEAFFLKKRATAGANFTPKDQAALVKSVALPPTRAAIEKVGELGMPEGDDEQVERILKNTEGVIEELEANPMAMYNPSKSPFDGVREEARGYGFQACIVFL